MFSIRDELLADSRRSVRFGPGCVVVDGLLLASAVPGIAVAPLKRELIHVVVQRLVAVAEDRLLLGNTVVARPDRARTLLRLQLPPTFDAAAAGVFEPDRFRGAFSQATPAWIDATSSFEGFGSDIR